MSDQPTSTLREAQPAPTEIAVAYAASRHVILRREGDGYRIALVRQLDRGGEVAEQSLLIPRPAVLRVLMALDAIAGKVNLNGLPDEDRS